VIVGRNRGCAVTGCLPWATGVRTHIDIDPDPVEVSPEVTTYHAVARLLSGLALLADQPARDVEHVTSVADEAPSRTQQAAISKPNQNAAQVDRVNLGIRVNQDRPRPPAEVKARIESSCSTGVRAGQRD
jgi:hypothetical protein